jgi:MFS family permease
MLGTPVNAAARHATYAMFLADGLGFGIWASHIPAFKQKFELSDSALSIVLLAVAAGSIVSMPVAGQAVRHFGSRRCIAVSLGCYALCLASLALAPTLGLFVVAALLFGAAKGGVDVGINAQAVIVERIYGRPIMASFQALWSVGGLAGGFLTSATLGLGSTPVVNLVGVAALILLLDLLYFSRLMHDPAPLQGKEGSGLHLPGKLCFTSPSSLLLPYSVKVLCRIGRGFTCGKWWPFPFRLQQSATRVTPLRWPWADSAETASRRC